MRLESVRSLKEELRTFTKSASRGTFGGLTEIGGLLDESAQAVPGGVALGIAPGGTRGDWRLAVRLTRQTTAAVRFAQEARVRFRGEVDAQFVGTIFGPRAYRAGVPELVTRVRPLVPGASIGHQRSTAGTLGAFAHDVTGRLVLLSNNHVLCAQGCRIGDGILQPGPADGGGLLSGGVVATLDRWSRLAADEVNAIDAATAVVRQGIDCLPSHANRPLAGLLANPPPNLAVWKIGRTTGYTRGRIRAVEIDGIEVAYGGQHSLVFDNQLEIVGIDRAFSDGGDSGSLILDDAGRAVGLLFAGGGVASGVQAVTYANPIDVVADAFGLTLA